MLCNVQHEWSISASILLLPTSFLARLVSQIFMNAMISSSVGGSNSSTDIRVHPILDPAIGGTISGDKVTRCLIPFCQRKFMFSLVWGHAIAANWFSTTQEKFHGGDDSPESKSKETFLKSDRVWVVLRTSTCSRCTSLDNKTHH